MSYLRHVQPGSIVKFDDKEWVVADQYARDKERRRIVVNVNDGQVRSMNINSKVKVVKRNG